MVVGKLQHRRLEVVVLSARGLLQPDPQAFSLGDGRRKVQLTLVSPKDPEGEAFGAKVSPWTEPAERTRQVRFGRTGLGLACSFPLDATNGAPGVAADPRFPEVARLRVRLFSSRVPSQNSALKAVAGFLPTAFANGVSHELDEATAQVEAEGLIPLANIVSGRVGFAADRALGGWVPLRRLGVDDPLACGPDDVPLSLWMQMYVLPDHEAMRPTIQAQLEHEIAKVPGSQLQQVRAPGSGPPAQPQAQPARDFSQVAAATGTQPRWGPAASPSSARDSAAAAAPDLLDVSLDDDVHDWSQPPAAARQPELAGTGFGVDDGVLGDLLDLDIVGQASALPRLGFLPVVGSPTSGAAFDLASAFGGGAAAPAPPAAGSSAFGFVAASSQLPAPTSADSSTGVGAFGFVTAASATAAAPSTGGSLDFAAGSTLAQAFGGSAFGYGTSLVPTASVPAAAGSVFGFIAAGSASGSPSAALDLEALYKDPGRVPPASRPLTDFSALTEIGQDGRLLVESRGPPVSYCQGIGLQGGLQGKSLQSLEESLVAGLSSSLRS